jgi:hypothetical protein
MSPTSQQVPPDPERMNDARSTWAAHALYAFMDATGTDLQEALSDLLADLMHWCDRNSNASFDDALARGRFHYNEETTAEEDQLIHGHE